MNDLKIVGLAREPAFPRNCYCLYNLGYVPYESCKFQEPLEICEFCLPPETCIFFIVVVICLFLSKA